MTAQKGTSCELPVQISPLVLQSSAGLGTTVRELISCPVPPNLFGYSAILCSLPLAPWCIPLLMKGVQLSGWLEPNLCDGFNLQEKPEIDAQLGVCCAVLNDPMQLCSGPLGMN